MKIVDKLIIKGVRKMISKNNIIKVIMLITLLVVVACQPTAAPDVDTPEEIEETVSVVFLLTQPLAPFESDIWDWIQQAEEDGYVSETRLIEMREPAEYESTVRQVSEQGFDVVISTFFFVKEAMNNVAPDFPETHYVLVYEPNEMEHENMLGILYEVQEGSYVCGVVAGHMTETGRVGFIGGDNSPGIVKFLAGYEAGVKSVDPDIVVDIAFAGTFADPDRGYEIALSQYQSGSDIIMHAANMTGLGVFRAAEEINNYAVGVDIDQSDRAPDHIICSALSNPGMSVYNAVVSVATGEWEGGTLYWGVEHGAPAVALTDLVSDEVKEEALEAEAEIISGEIVPPTVTDTE